MADRLRVLELFCGIGGCAAALGERADIAAAVDINQIALSVYRHNFPTAPIHVRTIESMSAEWYRDQAADLWWLSPPCQPYTSRGRQLDLSDQRAQALRAVIERIAEVRPRYIALENVAGFCGSQSHRRLRAMLDACGYQVREQVLCPTQLGVPNRRRRFYLVAAANGSLGDGKDECPWDSPVPQHLRFPVQQILDTEPEEALWMPADFREQYRGAVHVVDAEDACAETHCFTSSYGGSVVRSGSYLAHAAGVRRFSPSEILRLLCFPRRYRLPEDLPLRKAWQLVGNSLAVAAVRHVLAAIPELRDAEVPDPPDIPDPHRS
jgi:site-specific DNA-cytosine methylase